MVSDALVAALQSGRLGQAAVDVYDFEPLPAEHPFRSAPNLLMTPHIGFAVKTIFRVFADGLTESLLAWLDGKPAPNPYVRLPPNPTPSPPASISST